MDLKTIVIIGRSGCGKGTQVQKMKELIESQDDRKIFHLEAGERFRKFIKEDTWASELAIEVSEVGGLQPEFLSIWAWTREIIEGLKPDQHMFVDGTPRRLSEAKILESAFEFLSRPKVDIVYLNVSK